MANKISWSPQIKKAPEGAFLIDQTTTYKFDNYDL